MKKLILLMVTALMAITASAQVVKSRSLVKRENPTTWYSRIGISINNAAGWGNALKEDGGTSSAKGGLVVDFGFNKAIGKTGAYWGMELGFNQRGFKASWKDSYDDYEESISVNAWDFHYTPLLFGYKYSVTDKIQLDAHLGMFASIDMSQGVKYCVIDDGDKEVEDGDADEIFDNRFDIGIQAGIGVWYGKFNLDFTYLRGFVNMAIADDDHKLFQSNFMIRLGYSF